MWSAEISAFLMSRLKLQHIGLRGAIKLFKPQWETLSYDLLPTLSCRTQGSVTAPVYEFALFPFGVIDIYNTFFCECKSGQSDDPVTGKQAYHKSERNKSGCLNLSDN